MAYPVGLPNNTAARSLEPAGRHATGLIAVSFCGAGSLPLTTRMTIDESGATSMASTVVKMLR